MGGMHQSVETARIFSFCFITIMSNSGKSRLNEACIHAEQATQALQEAQEEEEHVEEEEWRQEEKRQAAVQHKAEAEAKAAAEAKAKAVADHTRRIREDSGLLL
jgi:predicted secreted acid phosphatase